jgi:hypothetical protein
MKLQLQHPKDPIIVTQTLGNLNVATYFHTVKLVFPDVYTQNNSKGESELKAIRIIKIAAQVFVCPSHKYFSWK